jgi:predicted nucleic acid-binding protein
VIVIDASVAVKWFRDERHSDLAERILAEHARSMAAPDLFAVEVAAALVRNANEVKQARPAMEDALAAFAAMLDDRAINLIRTGSQQVHAASRIALDLGHPLKDCIYLALAMERGCELITGDARFAAKARAVHMELRLLGE